ncbi:MAG: ABC transporter permease [Acidimicrobiia bacterium]|nr:ABC transporter permease [Acidimicrobiia bacterium]
MSVLVIAANNLRRLFRERANLFFVFVLPLALILVLGVTLGDDEPRIGVHVEGGVTSGAQQLIEGLEEVDGVRVELFEGLGAATDELEREDITALVVVPAGYDDTIASGGTAELEYRVIPTSGGFEMQSLVRSVVADQNTVIRAGRVVAEQTGLPPPQASERVAALTEDITAVEVVTFDADGDGYVKSDAVGFVAAQELVLFMFLMGMVAASALIRSRQLGVTQRMLATPATTAEVIAGEGLGRFAVAVIQGAFIVGATALMFGLDWGSWPATAAIVLVFALVATAAAMFVGALVSNENQTGAIGMALGLAFAALGGCMVPFEIFPNWLRSVAHITPHAWAVDAFTEVVQRGGGVGQIGLELAVLVLFGISLLGAASMSLRRAIVG